MSAQQLITEHIDLWTSAIKAKNTQGRGSSKKRELYGIKKLRELILELAVRGKLVLQDHNDEPASELLKRIAEEKEQLIKDKKIKKPKTLPLISEEERSIVVPKGWAIARLIDISLVDMGNSPPGNTYNKTGDGCPLINGPVEFSKGHFGKTIKSKFTSAPNIMCDMGDILVCVRGATTGRTNIASFRACIGRGVARVKALDNQDFINLLMWENQYKLLAKGTGTTFPSISYVDLAGHIVFLPPFNEQQRIVAKVDELMSLCDQLEQQSESSLDAHNLLVDTLLATLTDARDANELSDNWIRLADHFDTVITTDYAVEKLKQTILQLAVMGKLGPQDPNDEPASELLKRIAAEKNQLIKVKKIKKQKTLAKIAAAEEPFELPIGWKFERLGVFTLVGTGATPSRGNLSYWHPGEVNWVSSGETSELFVGETREKVTKLAVQETNVSIYPVGTLVLAMYGQGKTRGQITELTVEAGTNQACAAIRLVESSQWHRRYVKLFFQKSYFELRAKAAGGAQPNLNLAKVSETVIPIPSLSEQHRIVAKVDELMALCDQLRVKLQQVQSTQLHLADAMTKRTLT